MRLAIRDDDTSYFTSPEQLEFAWDGILGRVPISVAVTPNAFEPFHSGDVERYYQSSESRPLAENHELVAWLRHQLKTGRISVLCHGFTHEYRRMSARQLVAEYVWKPFERLAPESAAAKKHLEMTLGTVVETFVPPSNAVSRAGLEALRPHFANVIAAVPLRRVVDIRYDSLAAYCRRAYYHLRHQVATPHCEQVAGLNLLPSFSLTRGVSWEQLIARMELCRKLEADLIVAVHYWELDNSLRAILKRLIDFAPEADCRFVHCGSLFKESRGEWKEN
jgi:hypothetical protein